MEDQMLIKEYKVPLLLLQEKACPDFSGEMEDEVKCRLLV